MINQNFRTHIVNFIVRLTPPTTYYLNILLLLLLKVLKTLFKFLVLLLFEIYQQKQQQKYLCTQDRCLGLILYKRGFHKAQLIFSWRQETVEKCQKKMGDPHLVEKHLKQRIISTSSTLSAHHKVQWHFFHTFFILCMQKNVGFCLYTITAPTFFSSDLKFFVLGGESIWMRERSMNIDVKKMQY